MFKTKFSREMTVILVIKLVLLYTLWNLCFRDTKQVVAGERFADQVFGNQVKESQ
jgi:hypothetical protein